MASPNRSRSDRPSIVRPPSLNPLFAPVESLPGIGPRTAKLFAALAGERVLDLCWHLPSGLIDRRYAPSIAGAEAGRICTLTVRIAEHRPGRTTRQPYRILVEDDSGAMELVFFHGKADYLMRSYPPEQTRIVSGRVELYDGHLQMTHPDHVGLPSEAEAIMRVEPTYPLTAGLTQRMVAKAVAAALKRLSTLPEWGEPNLLAREGWQPWKESLLAAHHPHEAADLEPLSPARRRLAYDELLANQLALQLMRQTMKRARGRPLKGTGALLARLRDALPFQLTGSQEQAIEEITKDMAGPERMLRLLQGDVGSGKTLVALAAMLTAVEAGTQAAMMAPTEILARQHHANIAELAAAMWLEPLLLTGRDKGKERERKLAEIASGEAKLIVGTHALFQESVVFQDLGCAVVDEQHRFGVHQRLSLSRKGAGVDLLVMTATPIPRTLVLAAYGDMDVTRLTDKPPGRTPLETRGLAVERLEEVIEGIARRLAAGAQVYWVCPLVEESEDSDMIAAEARYQVLNERFPGQVGLVHGQLKGEEKDAAMQRFLAGETRLLVATTVIEVGVDVPRATVMVIEQAERFGLAQLHQLRGRVGRGSEASTCLLLYKPPLSENARRRLTIMRETEDGFVIAEEDLKLRGAGEVLGTRQSGLPETRVADLASHGDLLSIARDDAALLLTLDPELSSPRGEALRVLLYLFEREEGVRLLRSG